MKSKTLTARMFAIAGAIVAVAVTVLPVDAKTTQQSPSHNATVKKAATKQSTRTQVLFPRPNGQRVSVAPPRATDTPSVKPPYYIYRDTAEYMRAVHEYNRRQNANAQRQLQYGQTGAYQYPNYANHYGQYVQQYGTSSTRVGDLNKCDSCPGNLRGSVLNSAEERRYWAAVHYGHALTLRGRKMNGDLFTNREELVEEAMRCANIMEYLRTHRNPETNIAP